MILKLETELVKCHQGSVLLIWVHTQTHFGVEFGQGNPRFDFEGFSLISYGNQMIFQDGIYVKPHKDTASQIMMVPNDTWLAKCRVAVAQYNYMYNKNLNETSEFF